MKKLLLSFVCAAAALTASAAGQAVRFDFDTTPEGWNLGDATIADGTLDISNGQVVRTNIVPGVGTYTFEMEVPAVPEGEKWMNGINIFPTNVENRAFSLFVLPGTEAWRQAAGAQSGQMLARCFSDNMDDAVFFAINPGKRIFEIELQLVDGGYNCIWKVDGIQITSKWSWWNAENTTYGLEFRCFADGGAWQGDTDCTGTYTAIYSYFQYTLEDDSQTGIDAVAAAADAPAEYYNLQGIRVAEPTPGLYIRRQGNTVTKVII